MTEEKKSAGDVALEGLREATEGFLEVLTLAAEKAGRVNNALEIEGLKNVLSVKEVAFAVKDALGAAQHGDWKEFSAKMGEAASVGPNMATSGIYGAAQAIWDETVAVRMAQGSGEDYSTGTLLKEGFDVETTWISDRVFGAAYCDAVADIRINPNGPDEDVRGVDVFDKLLLDRPMVFEPDIITRGDAGGGHAHHHHPGANLDTVFEPTQITLPADQNTVFEPMEITLPADQNTVFEPMSITAADAAAAGPGIHDQLLSNAPDFDTSGFHFALDLGTHPDGGSLDLGAIAGGGGDFSPAGGDIAAPAGDSGGGFHEGGFHDGGGAGNNAGGSDPGDF